MLDRFECPDGITISVPECLEHCRIGRRCMTIPSLSKISQERDWNGVASTTQLIDGTMLTSLKLTMPYNVKPESRAFMMYGTMHHRELEDVGRLLGMAVEIPMSIDRDIFDLVEVEDGEIVMTDYKLWGSFKVAQATGLTKVGMKPDPSGAVYKTTSKYGKAGDPKMVPTFSEEPNLADNKDAELQLNRYRIMLREAMGITVQRLRLQITVRDGGTITARGRGVNSLVKMLPVRMLPDQEVKDYFTFKAECLSRALRDGWNEPCTISESWNGERCARYCDVWNYCSKGKLVRNARGGEDAGD